ncbi:MAG: SCO1664 family protein [Actinomycetes bacterium]
MATAAEIRELLATAPLQVHGRLLDSSNSALVVIAQDGPLQCAAVYKPLSGERRLWDFPARTLAHREVSAYDLSQMLGWDIVPPTVWRSEGPAGPGMCQLWIDSSEPDGYAGIFAEQNVPAGWHPIIEGRGESGEILLVAHSDAEVLRRLAVFDVLANNADRKIGHLLVDGPRLFGIDHGVTFNVVPKLRTVLWGFTGTPLGPDIVTALELFLADFGRFGPVLGIHLSDDEVELTRARARRMLANGVFPGPGRDGPAVPWPIV